MKLVRTDSNDGTLQLSLILTKLTKLTSRSNELLRSRNGLELGRKESVGSNTYIFLVQFMYFEGILATEVDIIVELVPEQQSARYCSLLPKEF